MGTYVKYWHHDLCIFEKNGAGTAIYLIWEAFFFFYEYSFIEAIDELFLHTLAYECIGNDFYTIAITYTWHLHILLTKTPNFH